MPVTDGFKTIAAFEYDEYDEFDRPRELEPWKYGGGWWVTTYNETITIPEQGTPEQPDYFPGGSYNWTRLVRSRQPFGPYEVLDNTPTWDDAYGYPASAYGAPGLFDWFKFEQGYWWVMVRDTITTPGYDTRVGARLWYSDDLNTWHLAPVPEPATVEPCDYWYEHDIQYHAGSGRYWATMIVWSGSPGGYESSVPGPFADDPTNYERGCVVSAPSPAGPWTITYPGFGGTTNQMYYSSYSERHFSNSEWWDYGTFELLAEDWDAWDENDRGKRSGQNGGKCFKIEVATEFVYPQLPWILYGQNYYRNPGYYYCYVLPYTSLKRWRTEFVMWHADDPTGPWTRTVLRAYTVTYNWQNLGCGSWGGTSTVTLDNNSLPGPWQIPNPPWYTEPYNTDYSIWITAWGDGDWLIQTPSEGEYQYVQYYLDDRRFYKTSGYPMDGPWTEYALPGSTTDLGWIAYHDGYWVLLCKDTDEATVKAWVGTSLSSLEVAPFFGTPPNLYAGSFPMWYAGDGQWLIYCAWNEVYHLAYPWWRSFSPGGAGWGTVIR